MTAGKRTARRSQATTIRKDASPHKMSVRQKLLIGTTSDRLTFWGQAPAVGCEPERTRGYGLGGPVRSQVFPGSCVGGSFSSPGSIVTWRGSETCPPRGPRSMYSPGLFGVSPGFCRVISYFPLHDFHSKGRFEDPTAILRIFGVSAIGFPCNTLKGVAVVLHFHEFSRKFITFLEMSVRALELCSARYGTFAVSLSRIFCHELRLLVLF